MKKFCLLILALLAGCAQQPEMEGNKLIITAFSTDFGTKVSENAFEAGDMIGIFLEKNASNLRYETSDGSNWAGFGNVGEFRSGDNVTAYYPYSDNAKNANAIEIAGGVDFMICPATPITVADNKASANLKFKHVLSKLVVSMERPEEINGVKTVSLDSIVVRNIFRKGVVDLATEKISGLTDKGDLRAFGTEIIVIPQTVQKTELVFKMANGEFDRLTYNEPIVLKSGEKTTFTATSNADLYFTSTLDLKNGDAQTDLPLSFYVAAGRKWTLTSSEPWLTFSETTGVGASTVKVSVAQNTGTPRIATLTLTDDKQAIVTQKPMQNYLKTVNVKGVKWTTRNLTGTTQGQTENFTLCDNPKDGGMFWKWGSKFMYTRVNGDLPSGHWGGISTMAATEPTTLSHNYDYGNVSGVANAGDPCKALGAYRTPTHTQWQALAASGYKWAAYQGVNGYFLGVNYNSCTETSIAPNCIFLPAAGYRYWPNGLLFVVGDGLYWSSSVSYSDGGWNCYFTKNIFQPNDNSDGRGDGSSVRCVAE